MNMMMSIEAVISFLNESFLSKDQERWSFPPIRMHHHTWMSSLLCLDGFNSSSVRGGKGQCSTKGRISYQIFSTKLQSFFSNKITHFSNKITNFLNKITNFSNNLQGYALATFTCHPGYPALGCLERIFCQRGHWPGYYNVFHKKSKKKGLIQRSKSVLLVSCLIHILHLT